MLWHGSNMSTLHLICFAMQVLMNKLTQRLFSMLLRQKKEEQLSLMSTHLTQMSSFCSSEDIHSFPRKLHLSQVVGHNREEYRLRTYMMNLGQQKQLPCQDFMNLWELTLQGPLQGKESYTVGKYSTKQMKT